jgi:disulfide bond formation protein DsbB
MKKTLLLIIAMLLILAFVVTGCGGSSAPTEPPPTPAPAGDPVKGEELFATCSACHGPNGEGVEGLGKDMTTSEFIASKSDDELVEFIKVGRAPDDPLNTTGVAMLPKGGNPALTDEDLYDIVAYIRTLHK